MAISLPDLQDVEKLTPETLDLNNKELWLISLPTEVQVKSLVGKSLQTDNSNSIIVNEESYSVQVQKGQTKVVPIINNGHKSGKLSFGDLCKGQLVIVKSPKMIQDGDDPQVIPSGYCRKEIDMFSLKQRWKPFGWKTPKYLTTPTTSNSKVKKHKHKKKDK